jgi:hypothetical protein
MRTRERNDIYSEVLGLKQASMSRALQAAREAVATGELRTRPRSTAVRYAKPLRVRAA